MLVLNTRVKKESIPFLKCGLVCHWMFLEKEREFPREIVEQKK